MRKHIPLIHLLRMESDIIDEINFINVKIDTLYQLMNIPKTFISNTKLDMDDNAQINLYRIELKKYEEKLFSIRSQIKNWFDSI